MKSSIRFRVLAALALTLVGGAGEALAGGTPIALRNVRELVYGYEALLQVNQNDPDLRAVYRGVVDRLPLSGAVSEFTSPMLLAATELGGAYCGKAVDRDAKLPVFERVLFNGVYFDRGPGQFGAHQQRELLDAFARIFWVRSMALEEEKALLPTFQTWITGHENDVTYTPIVMKELCTTFATSLPFLVK